MADTTPPTVSLSAESSILRTGQATSITFTLSEAASDFTVADIVVSGGTLSNFKGSGISYTAIFTPITNSPITPSISVASGSFSDAAGNKNSDGNDQDNKLSFLLERSFSIDEGSTLSGKLPVGTTLIGDVRLAYLDPTGSVTKEITWGGINIATDGSFSFGGEASNENGRFFIPTNAGDLFITVAPKQDAPHLVISEPGLLLGTPGQNLALGMNQGAVALSNSRRIVEQSDQRLVLVGYDGSQEVSGLALARFLPNGTVDRSYGSQGYSTIPNVSLFDAVVQKDDKIVVVGTEPSTYSGVLVRVNRDGSIDTGFSGDGRVNVPWGDRSNGSWVHAVELQSDGKIVAVGRAYTLKPGTTNTYELDFGVARFNTDGSPDTSFDKDGWVTIQLGGSDIARGVAIQPDGKILVGGYTNAYGNNDLAVVSLNADGTLNKAFGQAGITIVSMPTTSDQAYGGITLLRTGKTLLVGGSQKVASDGTIIEGLGLIVRLNANGTIDTGFGVNGSTQLDFPSLKDPIDVLAYDATERSDGSIIVPGNVSVEGTGYPAYSFAALLRPNGTLDTSFGDNGSIVNGLGQTIGSLVTSDGGFLFGSRTLGPQWSIDVPAKIKVLSTGALDSSFNPTPGFKPGGPAVPLSHLVSIYDADADPVYVGPTASFTGFKVTIQREGTPSVDDRFGSIGPVSFVDTNPSSVDAGYLQVGNTRVGSYEQTSGKLTITFESNATQPRVSDVLSNLSYTNLGSSAPAIIKLSVSVSDGTGVDTGLISLTNTAIAQPSQGISGVAYHWRSHILLSSVMVGTSDQKAMQADSDLFDLRAATYDTTSGSLTVQLWANPSTAISSFDFTSSAIGAKTASFTSSLSNSNWTVLSNAENPANLLVSGFLSNLAAPGVTGAIQLGTLSLTFAPNSSASVGFKNVLIGNSSSPELNLSYASTNSNADGRFSIGSLSDGSYTLSATRSAVDGSTNQGVTSADALAALKIAVGVNPNLDPDGAGPLRIPLVSPYQVIAADVNGDGKVTSADALAILKMSVKLAEAPAPEWFFVEEGRDFWDETSKQFTLTRTNAAWDKQIKISLPQDSKTNIVGILKGDVNGSWTISGANTVESSSPNYFKDLVQLIGVPADQWGIPPGG